MNGSSGKRTHREYDNMSSDLLVGNNLFYIDREKNELLHVYLEDRLLYEIHIPFDLINEASQKTTSEESFFEYIEQQADIVTTDYNASNYKELIDFYNSNHPHFSDMTQPLMVDIANREYSITLPLEPFHDLRKDTDIVTLVAAFEEVQSIPAENRYTSWFGDMDVYEAKQSITPLRFSKRVQQALVKMEMTYADYKSSDFSKSSVARIIGKMSSENITAENTSNAETLSHKEQLQQKLEDGVRKFLDSEEFKNWLSTSGTMFYKNYSLQNAMLIWFQKPHASYVMSYEKWKDFGRNVAQGVQGAKIFVPIIASEKYKGGLFKSIKHNLSSQLSKDASLTETSYRLGTSNLEFTMNRANGLIGYKVNGKERQIFGSDDEVKRFIDRAIIGKVPTGFMAGTVFDVSDTIVPEYLWVKKGYTKSEIAPDDMGRTVKNKRGEVRIYNTPERQARFKTSLDMKIAQQDPIKMQILFDACSDVCKRRGVPVSLAEKTDDEVLRGGASGYFSREVSEEHPYGYIVIDNSLEPTEKCSVLLHEMGHSRLHLNLDELAQQMGEKKIGQEMREVQAEAVAFATAINFGIETDISSFKYLAVYSRGFEMQEFKRSLEVIHAETKALTEDIRAELDIRGYNLDLTEKTEQKLNDDTLRTFTSKFLNFATQQGEVVQTAMDKLPEMVKENVRNYALIEILKYQKENLDNRRSDLDLMLNQIDSLNQAKTVQEQLDLISNLESSMRRIEQAGEAFKTLSKRYDDLWGQSQNDLYLDFEEEPLETLRTLSNDYAELAQLSNAQLKYIASSLYIKEESKKLLGDDETEFVTLVCERASLIPTVAAKNGTFVEVSFCEQWTDKPFFENGTLCSPKIADKIIAECEAQMRAFRDAGNKRDEYVNYTKCNLTVFTPSANGELIAWHTSLNIGDGSQDSLKSHLAQLCHNEAEKTFLGQFESALSERADKQKIVVPSLRSEPSVEIFADKQMSRKEWTSQINTRKAQREKEEHSKRKTRESKNLSE